LAVGSDCSSEAAEIKAAILDLLKKVEETISVLDAELKFLEKVENCDKEKYGQSIGMTTRCHFQLSRSADRKTFKRFPQRTAVSSQYYEPNLQR
jgi:hypothetical protein